MRFELLSGPVQGFQMSDVKALKRDLMVNQSYDKSIRPVFNQSVAVEVSM